MVVLASLRDVPRQSANTRLTLFTPDEHDNDAQKLEQEDLAERLSPKCLPGYRGPPGLTPREDAGVVSAGTIMMSMATTNDLPRIG